MDFLKLIFIHSVYFEKRKKNQIKNNNNNKQTNKPNFQNECDVFYV